MLFAATFLVNAGLNFVLNLLVAALLAPVEFGRYALAAAVAVLVNGVVFTWFSMAAARFTSDRAIRNAPSIRATLDGSLLSLGLGILGLAALTVIAWPGYGMPGTLLGLTLIVGGLHGAFDYACALARARFLDRLYARIVLVKNAMSFVAMLGAAVLMRDAHAVLIALGLSIAVALWPVRAALRRERGGAFETAQLVDFLRYAAPLVAAVVLYQLIPFLTRWLLASLYGFAEAGQFSLAFDTLYRVLAAIGASLEFILFQIAVRTDERHGREAAQIRVGENVVIVIAVLLPAAVGFWLVTPSLVGVLVPPAYREAFADYTAILLPAVLAQCLITSALSAVFQLSKRTAPLVVAALLGLGASVIMMAILPPWLGPRGFAWAQSGGMLMALGATLAMALPVLRTAVSFRDLAWIATGCVAMAAALQPWRGALSPILELPATVLLGGATYAVFMIAGNVAGVRTRLADALPGSLRITPRQV